eukprot:CAMPEP_0118824322 /NCGR_PEP_ID=MMETSP1162-20130426/10526_1 /TAXON_ID=33656 /ORGANISM="Phaeocystis Sp, Strain CCMP2710" /LENGTH=91 /DNA_ID=CAMNT_0006754961 /DNA_START=72 /DNA_END=343 /DNA_ORIENTATION=-
MACEITLEYKVLKPKPVAPFSAPSSPPRDVNPAEEKAKEAEEKGAESLDAMAQKAQDAEEKMAKATAAQQQLAEQQNPKVAASPPKPAPVP